MSEYDKSDRIGVLLEAALREQATAAQLQESAAHAVGVLKVAVAAIPKQISNTLTTSATSAFSNALAELKGDVSTARETIRDAGMAYRDAERMVTWKIAFLATITSIVGVVIGVLGIVYVAYPRALEIGKLKQDNDALYAYVLKICKRPAGAQIPECQAFR